mgnify:CR=1 FL=1
MHSFYISSLQKSFPYWCCQRVADWPYLLFGAAWRYMCGLCFDGRKYNRWFFTVAVLISGGIIVVTYIQACQGTRSFLDEGSFSIVVLSAVPRIGGSEHLWMNGLYDTICFAVVFPLVVCLGASGKTTDKVTTRVCRFLGDISYPLYMVHYPFIYLYYAWVKNENLTFIQSLPGAVALVAGSVVLAYLCLKLYDEPVRRFLSRRLRIN